MRHYAYNTANNRQQTTNSLTTTTTEAFVVGLVIGATMVGLVGLGVVEHRRGVRMEEYARENDCTWGYVDGVYSGDGRICRKNNG